MSAFPTCLKCSGKLNFFKCIEKDKGSKYSNREIMLICEKCSEYYIYNCHTKDLVELNLQEKVKLDIREVVKQNCKKELNIAQTIALETFEKMLERANEIKGIFSLPTGVGKTLLAACIIRYLIKTGILKLDNKILVLAPRRVILDQIVNKESDFYRMFKDLPIKIENVREDNTKTEHLIKLLYSPFGHVIVATPQLINIIEKIKKLEQINFPYNFNDSQRMQIETSDITESMLYVFKSIEKLSKDIKIRKLPLNYSEELIELCRDVIEEWSAIILDEVHHTYNGPKISEAIKAITKNSDFVIGLSATPTKESVNNIGKLIYYYPLKEAMNNGLLVSKIKFYKYSTLIKDAKFIDTGHFCKDPWKVAIEERAEKYAEKILEVIDEESKNLEHKRMLKSVVASPNTIEADVLYDALRKKIGGNHLYKVHYKQEKDNSEIMENFKKDNEGILVCVNMVDIGFDDKALEMLVIARPLSNPISYAQLRGRVLRKPPEENKDNIKYIRSYAIILDLADNIEKYQREYELLERIEKGEVEAENFEEDLKGLSDVRKAKAEVSLINKGMEIWMPEIKTDVILSEKSILTKNISKIVINDESKEDEIKMKLNQYKQGGQYEICFEYTGEKLDMFINLCEKYINNFDKKQQIQFYYNENNKRIYYVKTKLKNLKLKN
ncbi:MAG: DEAD/DEAH box helicase family protein [Nitrososphaeria archaeon]